MADRYNEIADRLLGIERELRRLGFWEERSPPRESLNSALPFCYDTLNLTQWVQFVLIVRMKALIEAAEPLPRQCDIASYAEEALRFEEKDTDRLLELLRELDRLLTR
jgi:uncharacterized protein YqcC (DUF446 family)